MRKQSYMENIQIQILGSEDPKFRRLPHEDKSMNWEAAYNKALAEIDWTRVPSRKRSCTSTVQAVIYWAINNTGALASTKMIPREIYISKVHISKVYISNYLFRETGIFS